jgi:hypothetical protein
MTEAVSRTGRGSSLSPTTAHDPRRGGEAMSRAAYTVLFFANTVVASQLRVYGACTST